MILHESKAPFYEAVAAFRQRCLVERRSISLPDTHPLVDEVWTGASARELIDRFVESPDESARSFQEKLADQLAEVSPGALQLLVDLVWLHAVVPYHCLQTPDPAHRDRTDGGDRRHRAVVGIGQPGHRGGTARALARSARPAAAGHGPLGRCPRGGRR